MNAMDADREIPWPANGLDPRLMKHEVLSREQELALARRMHKHLRRAQTIRQAAAATRKLAGALPPNSPEARRLRGKANRMLGQAKRWQRESDQARNELVLHNIRFVAKYAFRFASRCRHLQLSDLMLRGVEIMAEKLHMYDPETGNRVSTYMGSWIWHAITREMQDRERTVRIPVHLLEKQRKAEQEPDWELSPDDDDADESGKRSSLWPDADEATVQRLIEAMIKQAPFSLETALTAVESDNNLESLLDTSDLPDYHRSFFDDPETACERQSDIRAVQRAMGGLTFKERLVLRYRFIEGLTLEDTAVALLKRHGIGKRTSGGHSGKNRPANRSRRHKDEPKPPEQLSRERIRQIQEKALDKMRSRLAKEPGTPFI
jgi:RNA polymerase sigma factor (sigma-70 family)